MSAIRMTIHSTGTGNCSLTGKSGPGLSVTFDDGTVKESFLSWKGFQQLLSLKAGKNGDGERRPTAANPAAIPTVGTAK